MHEEHVRNGRSGSMSDREDPAEIAPSDAHRRANYPPEFARRLFVARFVFAAWAALVALFTLSAYAVENQVLQGHVPAAVSEFNLQPVGRLPATTNLDLAIGLPLRNQAALTKLLQQIYDPSSPNYRHFLTPDQFAESFGPTERDYEDVAAFMSSNGLTIRSRHSNRVVLDVTGTAENIEKAFQTRLYIYQHPVEARTFYAPDTEPSVPGGLAILDISGLNNYSRPKPLFVARPPNRAAVAPNAGSGPSGTYMGGDFRAAYAPGCPFNGTGQVVGLLQFDGYTASDITYYESKAGLPNVTLSNVLLDGFSGTPTGDGGEVEVSLDIEMSISMAPGLSEVIIYEAGPYGNWHDLLNRMATDNLAKQLSCSWYDPNVGIDTVANQIFQQMAAQGQSFFAACGDSDAYTGYIPFPDDTPYITLVGGTTLTTTGPGGPWVSETVWNWGIEYGDNGVGTGGGISRQYGIPTWQQFVSMATNQGSTTMRNLPDVALTADGVYVRADGADQEVGGTSCASPLWAGFTALVNQLATSQGRPTMGFINPAIYAIGTGTTYAVCFHDIATGNNTWSGSPTKFYAVAGYDLCTGWGSPNGTNLIYALALPNQLGVFAPASASAGVLTGAGAVTVPVPPTNNLTVTLSASPATLISVPPTVTIPAGNTNVTFTITVLDDGILDGTQTATITATASNYATGTASMQIYDSETATLTLSIPATATAGQGVLTNAGLVTVSAPVGANVNIALGDSNTNAVVVPPTVTVPNGQTSAVFNVAIIDNHLFGPPRTATVTAHVQNWTDGTASITVFSNTNLTLNVPAVVYKDAGVLTNAGSVSIDSTSSSNLLVNLASSDTTKVVVPATVTMAVGQTSAVFNVTILGDNLRDGTQLVPVTATASGFGNGSATIAVLDTNVAGFAISAIASPQSAGTPFPVSVAAEDINGTTITVYKAATTLSAAGNGGPDSLQPTTITAFTNGVWSGSVRVNTLDTNVRLTASDGGGDTGQSNPFNVQVGPVDHFVWGPISSPQHQDSAFPVTITAQDVVSNTAVSFTGPAGLSAMTTGPTTNLLGGPTWTEAGNLGTFTLGYSFTPNKNITVTHVRSYFGTKVSLWTAAGVLLASQTVTSVFQTWVETPLATPVLLMSNTTYVVAAYSAGQEYYSRADLPGTFPDGTINQDYYSSGDAFPTTTDPERWWFVDLRYSVGWVGAIPVSPTNTGSFVGGVWSGNVAVQDTGSNVVLTAADGAGHSGSSTPFTVYATADVGVTMTATPNPVMAGSNLTYGVTITNIGPDRAADVVLTDPVPANASFVSAFASQGSCTQSAGVVTCTVGSVSNGSSATVTIIVQPTLAGFVTNTVSVASSATDTNLSNNLATAITTVQGIGVLGVLSGTNICGMVQAYGGVGTAFGSVTAGQAYGYEASGCITFSGYPGYESADPDGFQYTNTCGFLVGTQVVAGSSFHCPSLLAWSLIGNIGTGSCVQLGSTGTFVAVESGPLDLYFNDDIYSDDSGSFDVCLTVPANFVSSGPIGGPFLTSVQSYVLTNGGTALLNWSATNSQPWLSLSATGGALAPGAATAITATITTNANALAIGSYTDLVVFSNLTTEQGNTNQTVALTVMTSPSLSISPASGFNSSGPMEGPFSPNSQVYTLTNTGGGMLSWAASNGQSWLSLSSSSGTLAVGGSATLTVSVNSAANSLTAGNYADAVAFTNLTDGLGSTNLPVNLTVTPIGILGVAPSGMTFSSSGPRGGPFSPTIQVYTVSNSGLAPLIWLAANSQGWLGLSAYNGTLAAGASTNLIASINTNANSLAVGSYSDGIMFTNLSYGAGSTVRPVSLTVLTPGTLGVSPSNGLTATEPMAGPFSPASQSYVLTNSGAAMLSWSATNTQSWVSLSANAGTLAGGASATVTVSINANAIHLTPGGYSDTVTFANLSNGAGTTTRPVTLTVTPPTMYTITTSSAPPAGGTTSGGGTYTNGSTATVTATPNPCYDFSFWYIYAVGEVSTSSTYSFTVNGNENLVAYFYLASGTITTTSSPPAGGTTTGGGTVLCGSNVTVCATANTCYSFVDWTDQNSNVLSTSACYTFTAASNQILVANFAADYGTTNLTTLWSFTGGNDGANPWAALVQGSDSNFYGTTYGSGSGPSANGTVFRISPGGSLTTLWSFTGGNDGANPVAGLVQGSDSNFYGTASYGGANGNGTVFRISPSGSLTNLWSFTGGTDGAVPMAGLVQGSDGNFYGTTAYGGANGNGNVFRMSPSGGLTNLWSFTGGNDGAYPQAGLVQGIDSNFYGTTYGSGSGPSAYGTVFRISPGGSLTTLWSFTGGNDGASPWAALVQGSDSNFYGTASDGGANGNGTVFRISPSGGLTTLWSFTGGNDGANPLAGLVQGSDGNFYGTTYGSGSGPSGYGTVFRISPSGRLTNLWSFTGCGDGANPFAGLVQGNDGDLYGTTYGSGNGPSAYGTVFKLSVLQHCSFSINATNATFGSAGGFGTVIVSASNSNCSWTASSTNSFIAITAGSSGSGSGTVSYTVAVNSNTTARSATLMIAEQVFTVAQASGDSVGDGIPDWWRAQYFSDVSTNGITTNRQSCAACDADGTGQNNLFKYIAGLDPTNPVSVFVVDIALTSQPPQNNLSFTPLALGRSYTPLFSTNLVSGIWLPLTAYIGPVTNSDGTMITITDTNPIPPQEFYRIEISLP